MKNVDFVACCLAMVAGLAVVATGKHPAVFVMVAPAYLGVVVAYVAARPWFGR